MQAKRIQVNETNASAGNGINVILDVPLSPREAVNFHNIWIGATAEPQDADANNQGTWVLMSIDDPTVAIPTFLDALVNLESHNARIIACGVYSASNQSPWTLPPTQIKTSRTLPAGGRLIMQLLATGVTVGQVSVRAMLCAHTVRA